MSFFRLSSVTFLILFSATLSFAEMPGPDAEALCKYVLEESPYTSWDYWPDHKGLQEGEAPHAPLHKVFVNATGLKSEKSPVGFGTIIVKENIGNDNALKALTVMYKVKDYNPEGGDWFWAKYSASGKTEQSGKLKGCMECHSSMKDNDYIFVHEFEE